MRLRILALALCAAGCSTKSQYQGDQVLGAFAFQTQLVSDSCDVLASGDAGFVFSGVFSYDTHAQKLFLDTDSVTDDDHVGTLSGRHFSVQNSAFRDLGCGEQIQVTETLEGDFFLNSDPVSGCGGVLADGGLADGGALPDAGVLANASNLVAACGIVDDVAPAVVHDDAGKSCGGCQIVYQLSGTAQTGAGQ